MNPILSVITPASRGIKELSQLLRDFRNQTLKKEFFEHIIIWDGAVPNEVKNFMEEHKNDYNIRFMSIEKDTGNMTIAPGTRPRNFGVSQASGDYVVFADDDDRYKSTYLESLIFGAEDNTINVVQMACLASRISNRDRPDRIRLIPEVGLPEFPVRCHVGTPCFIVKRSWALENPWRNEPDHDFFFIKRICDRYHPNVKFIASMQVDVDGIISPDSDWVTFPPMVRSNIGEK